ncbi:TPA: hypothetical protein ACGWER_001744 [Streptococcus agalactiae]|nr:hypothetical protein [Streptococcus agalactiae]HEO2267392.1 hypothetical protein [Streptococcus agalactiae]HEO7770318.1 hypothetical protein [Streptococcus agalactiae]
MAILSEFKENLLISSKHGLINLYEKMSVELDNIETSLAAIEAELGSDETILGSLKETSQGLKNFLKSLCGQADVSNYSGEDSDKNLIEKYMTILGEVTTFSKPTSDADTIFYDLYRDQFQIMSRSYEELETLSEDLFKVLDGIEFLNQ